MKHDDLMRSLADHLRANTKRMVWCDTQLGPVASPRPDVFTVDKSFAHFSADAYECKVSVSDLRSDVTSGKWQKYRAYAHRVWFAFPRGMAPLTEIPRECGVILLGEGWRAARKPVAQVLDTLPRDAWLKLLMDGSKAVPPIESRRADGWAVADSIRKKFGREVAELFNDRRRAESLYAYNTERLRAQAAELNDEIHKAKELRLSRELGEKRRLEERYRDLAVTLNMPPDCSASDLSEELVRVCRALNARFRLGDVIESLRALETIGARDPEAQRAA